MRVSKGRRGEREAKSAGWKWKVESETLSVMTTERGAVSMAGFPREMTPFAAMIWVDGYVLR